MGKTTEDTTDEQGFLDIFEIDHSKYQSEEEVVASGESDVEEIQDDSVIENEEEVVEEPSEKTEEPEDEKEEEPSEDIQQEASSKDEDDNSSVSIESLLGELVDNDVLLYDEEKEYEAGANGLKELVKETIEKKSQEVLESFKKSLPEEANKMLELLEKGGTIEDYLNLSQEVEFSKIPLEDKNGNPLTSNQTNLIKDWMEIQKYTKEEIEETLKDYEQSGLIKKQAEIARKKLSSWQSEKNETLLQQREQEKIKQAEEETAAAEAFKQEVTNVRDIVGFKITKDKAEKLYDFITTPGKDGKTKFQEVDTNENRLLYAYMAMEGFDKDKLVKDVASKQALKLKKSLSNYKDNEASPKRGATDVRREQSNDVVKNINWIV